MHQAAESEHPGADEQRPAPQSAIAGFLAGPRLPAPGNADEYPQPDRPGPARPPLPDTGSGPARQPGGRPAGQKGKPPQWKVQPLPGEPPLTLYRDKRMVMLPAGTEVDRYGDADGNVTYAARTQYQHRSLPADWNGQPYHAYRLQRPIEALTGIAVPWFEQPGGGTVFVLPTSVNDLLADGTLVEVGAQSSQNG